MLPDINANSGTRPARLASLVTRATAETIPSQVDGVQSQADTAALSKPGSASSRSSLALTSTDKPRDPRRAPKSSVLEALTAQFRAIARQHETSNSFNPLSALQDTRELTSFLEKPRGPQTLSDGSPGGTPPSKDKNRFAERVRTQVAALGDWILRQPPNAKLTPTDIYQQALKLNRGDAFNARLTAHNLMKEVAATESGHPQTDGVRNNAINERLINLRDPRTKGEGNYTDKMGPWYHLFSMGVISAAAKGATLGSGWAADLVGQMANEKVKGRTNEPGRVNDVQEEAVRLWANRVFD